MSFVDSIKDHPKLVIGGVVGLVVILYVLNHSGSTPTTATAGVGSSVDAATGYQQAQLAASSQANQTAAAVSANKDSIAGSIELAKIQAQQSGAHDALAAQVATSNIDASAKLQSLIAAMSADVAKTQSNNDVAKTSVLATNQTQQQQILASSLMHAYDTSAQTAQAGYSAQVAVSRSRDEHTGGLFGGGGFLGLGI